MSIENIRNMRIFQDGQPDLIRLACHSMIYRVKHHIEKQETVHQELSFEDEYDQLLEENGFNAYQDFMRASFSAYAAVNNHIKNKRK